MATNPKDHLAREHKERALSLLEDPNFSRVLKMGFSSAVKDWKESLLYTVDLDPGHRKGLVIALRSCKEVLTDLWENAGKNPPDWIEEVF